MSLRAMLNNHRKTAVATAGLMILLVLIWFLLKDSNNSVAGPALASAVHQCFYTTDDGKTQFPDSIFKDPPFMHDGKPAVRAHVFTTDGGKTRYVSYLERYSDYAIRMIAAEKARAAENPADDPGLSWRTAEFTEVKRPGDPQWVKLESPAGKAITTPKPGSERVNP